MFSMRRPSGPCVVLEIGAGESVPTIRMQSREASLWPNTQVIRINPGTAGEQSRDDDGGRYLHLNMGALEALEAIDNAITRDV